MSEGLEAALDTISSWRSSGWLLGLKFLGFYMNYNQEAKGLTFRRASEVSQVYIYICTYYISTSVYMSCSERLRSLIKTEYTIYALSPETS